jgi:hypothetical protein
MIKRNHIFILFLLIALIIMIQMTLSYYLQVRKETDSTNNIFLNNNMSRIELLNTCKSCHLNQHENEMIGPHANAYESLLEHKDYVNKKEYHSPQWTQLVNHSFETTCIGCHAPINLFEGVYSGMEFMQLAELRNVHTSNFFKLPKPREATDNRISGIDCLSCHYNGKHILATGNFLEKEEYKSIKGYCFPKPSAFLSSDLLCTSCHHDNYNEKDNFENITSMNCNGCHTEKTNFNNTHYTYWKKSQKQLTDSSYFHSIISNLNITSDKLRIYINLKNGTIPHLFNVCRETIIYLDLIDHLDNVIVKDQIVLNRREDHLSSFKSYSSKFSIELQGKVGSSFKYKTDVISKKIERAQNKGIKKINVNVVTKGQYWHNDSSGVSTFKKTFLID